eukprot:13154159-Alexandrium_andersonii.AAC.1
MSASLVGSEMCIRDRRLPCTPFTGLATRLWLPTLIGLRQALTNCHAVSYTHLTLPTICSV